ncbi:zinc finger protein 675-like [Phlebotomus papatasi]|uniref:zinc finger protein 675-like n=1 Tax=Phlebotomus papatasi TaxID=29031 RepID=UPI0024846150|nr:zinc finger protein 675-like [Phlebotomus papatasi]
MFSYFAMDITENSFRCDFVQNLYQVITKLYGNIIDHESSIKNCEICSENSKAISFIKNQLYLIMSGDSVTIWTKNDENSNKEQINDKFTNKNNYTLEVDDCKSIKEEEEEEHGFKNILTAESNVFESSSSSDAENPITIEDDPDKIDIKHVSETENAPKSSKEGDAINKPYECAHCHIRVSLKANLAQHMKLHMPKQHLDEVRNGKFYPKWKKQGKKKCSLCKAIYKKVHECKLLGQKHVRNTFSCSYCPETFTFYPKIYMHHKIHHPDKPKPLSPYQCEICGAFAIRSYALQRHMMFHTDYAPFECETCKKKFRTRQKLKDHQRIHIPKAERDDKYKCEICQKQYHSSTTLKTHKLLKHTKRETFSCSVCQRKFLKEISLKKHLPVHEGEAQREHKCEDCGRRFKKLGDMNRHRKKDHKKYTELMLRPKTKKKAKGQENELK